MAGPPGPYRRRPFSGRVRLIAAAGIIATVGGFTLLGRPADAPRIADAPSGVPLATAAPRVPGHEVYGFVPYWEIDDSIAAHLRTTDATTIGLFSVTHDGSGAIDTEQNGYRRVAGPVGRRIVADAQAAGRRVDVAWTSFGRTKNDRLFDSLELQDKVIAGLVGVRAELGVDGLAVDVEEMDEADVAAFGLFVGRLRTALRAESPGATVTVTTGAGPLGAAMAAAAAIAGADRVFLMGYDYRTAGSEPGASAPLVRRDGQTRALGWSLDLYEALGVPIERTVLGLPLYGLVWPVVSADVGAPATGRGDVWVPRRNLATLERPGVTATYDAVEDVQHLAVPDGDEWQAVYYDTPRSLTRKLHEANERGLAGAGFWALGYERGLPEYTELIAAFRAGRSMADLP
jgi:hypothetical protein